MSPTPTPPGADGVRPTTDGRSVEPEVDGLRRKLETLPRIEQAKGVVMALYGIDADAAFDVLKRWSSSAEVGVRELAAELVDAVSRPHGRPLQAVRDLLAARGLAADVPED
jgi:hypothetical protein